MLSDSTLSLASIERQLRSLLPADLYAAAWLEPNSANLMRVFQHLRTLQHILNDYTPRQVSENPPGLGKVRYTWREGTLLFTDLAGFTSLLEANAKYGRQGAILLLKVLNQYFSEMIEIVSKSGGDLLEFTGDAMLVQFLADAQGDDVAQAVRAGLRMQRTMAAHFANIEMDESQFSLGMRVGIHSGRFLTADIGTPMRMAHVLLGRTVQQAKHVEGAGKVGQVCLTQSQGKLLQDAFHFEPQGTDYLLVQDDFTSKQLGEYDITVSRRRQAGSVLFDRSVNGLLTEITEMVRRVEPLASYMPKPILKLLVQSAAQRQIPPDFPDSIVLFINLLGLPESVDDAMPDEVDCIVTSFSKAFAAINAAVITQGGILQKVTYQLVGSDILVYFGVLDTHCDSAIRAANAAIAVRNVVTQLVAPCVDGKPIQVACRMGLTSGAVFAAEIGEPRGRREFNILGDPVNTAARLMTRAAPNQILMTGSVYQAIASRFDCDSLGKVALKGKSAAVDIFALRDRIED